jgi:hypothetical protein
LQSLEPFHQDLNGDGLIGPPTTVIEANGSTHLTEVGNHFFLYDSAGSGPSLKYAGADVVAGQFGAWAPIGAEQTTSGYEVAWKVTAADQYTVWNTDSSGNYITSIIGTVSGTDHALQSLEPSFHQDLNGDGLIGPSTIGAGETLEVISTYSGQVSFTASTGILELLNSSGFAGTVAGMTGQDTIDFADIDPTKVQRPTYSGTASGGTLTVTDGSHTANIALLGNYTASTFVTSSDGHGGTNVVDPSATETVSAPGQSIPINHVIVLVQENHSFDQYFGSYPGLPAGFGIPPGFTQPNGSGGLALPLSGDAAGFNNVELFVPLKPFEEWAPGMTKDKLIEQVQAEFSQQFTGIGFNLPGQLMCYRQRLQFFWTSSPKK